MVRELIIPVGLYSGFVSFFLLQAANRLSDRQASIVPVILGAVASGLYGVACLFPELAFLGAFWWRLLILLGVCLISFGIRKRGLYAGALYLLFQTVLRGLVPGSLRSLLAALLGAGILYIVWLRRRKGAVKVELSWQGRNVRLNALQDTGNTLKDPVTGKPVLIIGPKATEALTGLTKEQLQNPIKTIKDNPIRGLRLIPYRTINNPSGMLLALTVDKGKIGGRKGKPVVAFAPEELDDKGHIQALTGGTVC